MHAAVNLSALRPLPSRSSPSVLSHPSPPRAVANPSAWRTATERSISVCVAAANVTLVSVCVPTDLTACFSVAIAASAVSPSVLPWLPPTRWRPDSNFNCAPYHWNVSACEGMYGCWSASFAGLNNDLNLYMMNIYKTLLHHHPLFRVVLQSTSRTRTLFSITASHYPPSSPQFSWNQHLPSCKITGLWRAVGPYVNMERYTRTKIRSTFGCQLLSFHFVHHYSIRRCNQSAGGTGQLTSAG